jgi:hypothetical protein
MARQAQSLARSSAQDSGTAISWELAGRNMQEQTAELSKMTLMRTEVRSSYIYDQRSVSWSWRIRHWSRAVLQRFSSPTPPLGLMQDQDGVVKLYGRKRTRGQGYAANQRVVETQFPREVWEPRGPANMDKISV